MRRGGRSDQGPGFHASSIVVTIVAIVVIVVIVIVIVIVTIAVIIVIIIVILPRGLQELAAHKPSGSGMTAPGRCACVQTARVCLNSKATKHQTPRTLKARALDSKSLSHQSPRLLALVPGQCLLSLGRRCLRRAKAGAIAGPLRGRLRSRNGASQPGIRLTQFRDCPFASPRHTREVLGGCQSHRGDRFCGGWGGVAEGGSQSQRDIKQERWLYHARLH